MGERLRGPRGSVHRLAVVLVTVCLGSVGTSWTSAQTAEAATPSIFGATWTLETALFPNVSATPQGNLVVTDCSSNLTPTDTSATRALSATGEQLWSIPGSDCNLPAVTDMRGDTFVPVGNQVRSYDSSGALRWSTDATLNARGGLTLGWDGRVYGAFRDQYNFDHVFGFDSATGALERQFAVGLVTGLHPYSGGLVIVNNGVEISYFDYTGTLQHRYTATDAQETVEQQNSLIGTDGTLFLFGNRDACSYDVEKWTPAGMVWLWLEPDVCNELRPSIGAVTPDGGVIIGRWGVQDQTPDRYYSITADGQLRWEFEPTNPPNTGPRPVANSSALKVDLDGTVVIASLYDFGSCCIGSEISFLDATTGRASFTAIDLSRSQYPVVAWLGTLLSNELVVSVAGTSQAEDVGVAALSVPALTFDNNLSLTTPGWIPPAQVAPPGGATYVALGDSYSSGEGLSPFYFGTHAQDASSQGCHRSVKAYPSLVAKQLLGLRLNALYEAKGGSSRFKFTACSGAIISDLYSGGAGNQRFDQPVDGAQLSALGADTRYVSITIGGNDVGFGDLLKACAVAARVTRTGRTTSVDVVNAESLAPFGGGTRPQTAADCAAVIDQFRKERVAGLRSRLSALYTEISQLAPNARIVVANYPRVFWPDFFGKFVGDLPICAAVGRSLNGYRVGFYSSNVAALNDFQVALNGEITEALEATRISVGDRIRLVDAYASTTQNGLTCGDTGVQSYISGLLFAARYPPVSTASFHPKAIGQKFLSQLVASELAVQQLRTEPLR